MPRPFHFAFAFLLILSSTNHLHAQTDFRDGFIVTLSNDTIRGQVRYQNDKKAFRRCSFRKNEKIEDYDPWQIKGYGFDGDKRFVTGRVDSAFVEVLVEGPLTLYSYTDKFFLQKGSEIEPLEAKFRMIRTDAGMFKQKDETWKRTLYRMVSDCNLSLPNQSKITFTEPTITKIVVKYNQCKDTSFVVYKSKKNWASLKMGAVIEANHDLFFKGVNYTAQNLPSIDYAGGVVFVLGLPRINESVALQAEILLGKSRYSIRETSEMEPNTYVSDISLSHRNVVIPLSFRYTFAPSKLSNVFHVGVVYYNINNPHATEVTEIANGNTIMFVGKQSFYANNFMGGGWVAWGLSKPVGPAQASMIVRYSLLSPPAERGIFSPVMQRLSFSFIITKR